MPVPSANKASASKPIKRAMVLAAGFGKRLRPITDTLPKPLVQVGGRAMLDRALDKLEAVGVEEVVINVHYLADKIEAHVAGRQSPRIIISDEREKILDTGGGIAKALPHFKGEPFFYVAGDTLWSDGVHETFHRMQALWDLAQMDSLMLLASMTQTTSPSGLGDFTMDQLGRLQRRTEGHLAPFYFASVQIIHPRLYEGCPTGPFSNNLVWDKAIAAGRLYGMRLDGLWMPVGTPDELLAAEAALSEL